MGELRRLKDGSHAETDYVAKVLSAACLLRATEYMVFYELVTKCHLEDHVFHGEKARFLREYGLIEDDGRISPGVRAIILSALHGQDFDLVLGNPFAVH